LRSTFLTRFPGLAIVVFLTACPTVVSVEGPVGGPGEEAEGNEGEGEGGQSPPGSNLDIYTRLRPTCVGCHAQGTTKPLFASLVSFENLVVYNESYVVPGSPDTSELSG